MRVQVPLKTEKYYVNGRSRTLDSLQQPTIHTIFSIAITVP